MELPKSVTDGLALCASKFEGAEMKSFLQHVFSVAAHQRLSDNKLMGREAKFDIETKNAFAAALSLALEAARQDAGAEEINTLLEDAGILGEQAEVFQSLLTQFKPHIRSHLSRIDISFPVLIGVEWRLDFYMKSDSYENARQPIFFITLHTRLPDGSIEPQSFTCNYPELQDLLSHLTDACNQAKKRARPSKD